MLEVILIYRGEDGLQEIVLDRGKVSFGRGGESDRRFPDNGLSRLHATVYREGDRVWIIDENSTNGSFVNDEQVGANGTPLRNGDEIKIGHQTRLSVRIFEKQASNTSSNAAQTKTVSAGGAHNSFPILMILGVLGIGLLVIGASAAFIGYRVWGDSGPVVEATPFEDEEPTPTPDKENKNSNKSPTPTPTVGGNSTPNTNSTPETIGNSTIETKNDGTQVVLPKGRYQDMSEADKDKYIAVKAEKIARIIGNQKSEPIPAEAVKTIKTDLTGYVNRLKVAKNDNCVQGQFGRSDFGSVLTRATKTSPFVVRAFRAEGIEPQIGIYVAMVESEHCACLTSKTGAKGMFQFLASTWGDYYKESGDSRCLPEISAKAGAQYLKVLITRYGTAPDSVLLAIASFNSGQGNLSKNLDKALSNAVGQDRSFWTLMANKNLLEGKAGDQFKGENIKYVPKFFAGAIIGENPQDFGVGLRPLSTYTQ